jgi:hypothetical protein
MHDSGHIEILIECHQKKHKENSSQCIGDKKHGNAIGEKKPWDEYKKIKIEGDQKQEKREGLLAPPNSRHFHFHRERPEQEYK